MQRKSYVNREGKFSGDPTLQGRGAPVPDMPEAKVEAVEEIQSGVSSVHVMLTATLFGSAGMPVRQL